MGARTLFLLSENNNFQLRVIDLFLFEGIEILDKIVLSILVTYSSDLIKCYENHIIFDWRKKLEKECESVKILNCAKSLKM